MIQFVKPLYLILLIPLIYYTVRLTRVSFADLSPFRRRFSLALRITIITLLVLSLAGARMVRQTTNQCVIFVADVSDSVPRENQDAAIAYINEALRGIKTNQKVGIVAFGGNAFVELAPGNAQKVDKIYSIPDTTHTDISRAIGLALASFPDNYAKKIVLLSDGNETHGKAGEYALLASSEEVSIDTVPIGKPLPHEGLFDKMICPDTVKIGEPFDLKLVVVSKEPGTGVIRILRNGVPIEAREIQLAKGKSVVTVQQSIDKAGSYEYEAILDCGADTLPENNFALGYVMVQGKPKILYLEGEKGQQKHLARALGASDIEVEVRDKSGVPSGLAQMRNYDALIFSDIPAYALTPNQLSMIESGVRDLGIGFTMVGGENSFGAGGYFDTPVERALPLDMSVKKTKVLPSCSIVIVMDKSGSMGAPEGGSTKIQLANDAAAAVVKLLQPIDYISVVVCHSFPVTAVPLKSAEYKESIYGEISTIRAEGGGIAVFPSMQMAYDIISKADTRIKHIILLADGSDCDDQPGCVPLAKKMANEKITVTSVAIGGGPHVPFLKDVAAAGNGSYYLAQRASDLKAIFTKDVMTVSKSLIIEEPFTPKCDPSSPELSGIDLNTMPPLLGYVATSPKPAAEISMTTHKDDPLMATWQYGLGKSAAFTSDCKAKWSARWLPWNGYTRLWVQLVRSTMRRGTQSDYQTTIDVEGGTGSITIDAVDEKGSFINMLEFKTSVIGPDMKASPVEIEQTGPGRYEGTFDARSVGTYVISTTRRDKPDTAPESSIISIPYSPEYKDIAPNTGLLQTISKQTYGAFDPAPAEVFGGSFRKTNAYTDLWRILALVCALLLPLDVAVRRLSIGTQFFSEIWAAVRQRLHGIKQPPVRKQETVESVSTLLKSRRSREEKRTHIEPIITPVPKKETPTETVPQAEQFKQEEGETTSRLLDAKRRLRQKKENPDTRPKDNNNA